MVDSWGELPERRTASNRGQNRGEERFVAAYWWYIIIAFGILAVVINGSLAFSRRGRPMVALARSLAGVISLAAVIGVIVEKTNHVLSHPKFQPSEIFIAAGVFIFAVLFLPTYVERTFQAETEQAKPTLQERAARPVNATVRLRDKGTDEWVN
jgi:cell division protein FtsW (lipid II flippase)